ncbi:MAG: hypothetical protein ABFQ95_06595 [Pseudomonadota bacterium]
MLSFSKKSLISLCGVLLAPFINPVFGSNLQDSSEQRHYSFPNVQKGDGNFYYGRMRSQTGKKLWLAMEKIDIHNYDLWSNYISVQANPRVIGYASRNLPSGGTTGDGSLHFKRVLKEISYIENEIWVAYITNALAPRINSSDIASYNSQDVIPERSCFAKNIEMFVTVTSSPKALITSHMGITFSAERSGDRVKRISLDLHSFAAKVMLMRNPDRKFMINAPGFSVEKMLAKVLPEDTFVGTREMRVTMQKSQGVGRREFAGLKGDCIRVELEQKAIAEAKQNNLTIERKVREMKNGKTEEKLRKKVIKNLPYCSLVEMGDDSKFVASETKIESQYSKKLDDAFSNFKNPYPFPAETRENRGVEFLKFMEQHPPILSADNGRFIKDSITIFDPNSPAQPWLTINEENKTDYQWVFKGPFAPAGATHFIAVNLVALAKSKSLVEPDLDIYKDMGTPYSIMISDEDYADPDGEFVDSLKNNSSVVDLTIHTEFNDFDNICYNNYQRLILEGLQNKPNLKRLTIVGNLYTDLFFQSSRICIGDQCISPETFLKFSHLQLFANLKELHVDGLIMGANRNDIYFCAEFLGDLQRFKKLQKFSTKDPKYSSFEFH